MASNSSVTSVLANAKYAGVSIPPQVDQVVDAVVSSGPWAVVFTILALLVAYDQSKTIAPGASMAHARSRLPQQLTMDLNSYVHREEGPYRGTRDEAALYGPVPPVGQSQIRGVLREMGQRPSELRLRLPQVCQQLNGPR